MNSLLTKAKLQEIFEERVKSVCSKEFDYRPKKPPRRPWSGYKAAQENEFPEVISLIGSIVIPRQESPARYSRQATILVSRGLLFLLKIRASGTAFSRTLCGFTHVGCALGSFSDDSNGDRQSTQPVVVTVSLRGWSVMLL